MFQKSSLRKFALTTLSATFLSSEILYADAYEAGTFSFKPINMDLASFPFGRQKPDSFISSQGLDPFSRQFLVTKTNVDAYHSPLSFGFHSSDRNGYGYGIELGYVFGWDTEIFGRAGFSHERPLGRFLVGDRSFNFKPRTNWGLSFGLRHYFDYQSPWKPFISAASGFTIQGATKALVNRHNPLVLGSSGEEIPIRTYKFLKRKALLNLELGGGTDYVFDEHWALSLSIAVRYSGRGGSNTVMTPADNTVPFPSPALPVTYKDHRPKWTVPVTVSLKTTGVLDALAKVAQAIPGMPSAKKEPGFLKQEKLALGNKEAPKGQAWVGDITSDLKYTHYRESGKRYKIDVWQGLLVVPVQDFQFRLDLQHDVQSGASTFTSVPASVNNPGQPDSVLVSARTGSTISENRNEATFTTTYNLKDSSYDFGLYYSAENDFLSKGLNVGGTWSFNKNNTILTTNAGISAQTVKPIVDPSAITSSGISKRSKGKNTIQQYYISLRQDLSKYNYFIISNEYQYQHGMLTDPYKANLIYGNGSNLAPRKNLIYLPGQAFPSFPAGVTLLHAGRPNSRSIWMPMLRFVQYVPWTDGAAHFGYRFGADTWGIRSHMFELSYYQPFRDRWEVVPLIRYYSQNAAKFYGPTFTVAPTPSPFPAKRLNHRTFTGDYRLARFGSLNYEIKLTYKVFEQMKFGFTAGYYVRKPGYSMAKKDRIPNPEYKNAPIGAKYFGVDLNFKF